MTDTELEHLRLELKMLKDGREAKGDEKITIGGYLLTRLDQLGVTVRPTLVHDALVDLGGAENVWSARRF
jgi:hypothetical protein